MSAATRSRNQVWGLAGTALAVLLTGLYLRLHEAGLLDFTSLQPKSIIQWVAFGLLVAVAAGFGALVGRRMYSRFTGILLGVAAGSIVAVPVDFSIGLILGSFVAVLVSFGFMKKILIGSLRVALVLSLGGLGIGLTRRIFIDGDGHLLWLAYATASAFILLQLAALGWFVARWQLWRETKWKWLIAASLVCCWTLIVPMSWLGGWHGELYRRLRRIENKGGRVHADWRRPVTAQFDWLLSPPTVVFIIFDSPDLADLRTLSQLSPVSFLQFLHIDNEEILAQVPPIPTTSILALGDVNIPSNLFTKRSLPNITRLSVVSSRLQPEAMRALQNQPKLVRIYFRDTRITGAALAELSQLRFLNDLIIDDVDFSDADMRGLSNLPLTTLKLKCPRVTSSGLVNLQQMPNLTTLFLHSTLDEHGITQLLAIPNLVVADLTIDEFTPGVVAALKQMQNRVQLTVRTRMWVEGTEFRAIDQSLPNVNFVPR